MIIVLQAFLNFLYTLLDSVFLGVSSSINPFPTWYITFISFAVHYGAILAWFVPLKTFIIVALWVFSIQSVLMVFSIFKDLL